MFPGFDDRMIAVSGTTIRTRVGGSGPPLLLLHGYPQTHAIWHKIAPALAERFTVVLTDLRGYGDSGKPPTTADHAPYAKRAMALDQVEVMQALGFERFSLVGHDRGGRVGHRLALDHPGRVERMAVLDIAPTATVYARADFNMARAYYHWFFLIQPADFPERLIGSDPDFVLSRALGALSGSSGAITEAAYAEYQRCFRDPAMIHASCEDYRAGASIDLVHDAEDRDARIACPLLVLWGALGVVGRLYDVLEVWREKAVDVTGHAVPGGHYLPEEAPEAVLAAILDFMG